MNSPSAAGASVMSGVGKAAAPVNAVGDLEKPAPVTSSKMQRLQKLKEARARAKAQQLAETPPTSLLDMAARTAGTGVAASVE